MYDWQQQSRLFDYVDELIATEAAKYESGTPVREGFERLKAVVKYQRDLVEKIKTVTPENAQALFAEMAAAHAKYLRALTVCSELMQQAGMDYNRDLLRKIQEFSFPGS